MPHPSSDSLSQLSQILQLVAPFQQQQQQQAQQQQLMQYHQQQLQQTAQQHAEEMQYKRDALSQTSAHETSQEKFVRENMLNRLNMEEDQNGVSMFNHATSALGMPVDKAIAFLTPKRRQQLLDIYAQEHAKQVPLAQSIAAGIWNSSDALKRGMDPSTLEMTALASAGMRPADFSGDIDRSGFNPYPGFKPPADTSEKVSVAFPGFAAAMAQREAERNAALAAIAAQKQKQQTENAMFDQLFKIPSGGFNAGMMFH